MQACALDVTFSSWLAECIACDSSLTWNTQQHKQQLQCGAGELAELKYATQAALQAQNKQTQKTLSQYAAYLQNHSKSSQTSHRSKRSLNTKRQLVQQKRRVSRLQHALARQGCHIRKHNAQHVQRFDRVEQSTAYVGLEVSNRLTRLAREISEGREQHMELRSQVRNNSRAQELLHNLSAVINELRAQLQVLLHCFAACTRSAMKP